jgi:hypothetical protein
MTDLPQIGRGGMAGVYGNVAACDTPGRLLASLPPGPPAFLTELSQDAAGPSDNDDATSLSPPSGCIRSSRI